jgi:hypothetical protein
MHVCSTVSYCYTQLDTRKSNGAHSGVGSLFVVLYLSFYK